MMTVEPSPLAWLEIRSQQDADFMDLARAAVGEEALGAASAALPYAITVTNRGKVPIVSVTVRYKVTVEGRAIHWTFTQGWSNQEMLVVSPPEFPPGIPAGTPVVWAGREPAIAAGATSVFTPLHSQPRLNVAAERPNNGGGGWGGSQLPATESIWNNWHTPRASPS